MQCNLKENRFLEVPQPCLAEYHLFDINGEDHNVLVLNSVFSNGLIKIILLHQLNCYLTGNQMWKQPKLKSIAFLHHFGIQNVMD